MGTVFRKSWTAPVPPGAEIVEHRGKRIAPPPRDRIRSGKLRTAEMLWGGTAADGRVRMRGTTKSYIAKFRDAAGYWIERPTGCSDETAARAVLAQLERRAELVKAGVLTPEEDAASRHLAESIKTNLDAWRDHLTAQGQHRALVHAGPASRGPRRDRPGREAPARLHRRDGRALAHRSDRPEHVGWHAEWLPAGVRHVHQLVRPPPNAGRLTPPHNPLLAVAVADQRADTRRQRRGGGR